MPSRATVTTTPWLSRYRAVSCASRSSSSTRSTLIVGCAGSVTLPTIPPSLGEAGHVHTSQLGGGAEQLRERLLQPLDPEGLREIRGGMNGPASVAVVARAQDDRKIWLAFSQPGHDISAAHARHG